MNKSPKFKYKIVSFCGDLYYQEMGTEEALDIVFHFLPENSLVKNADEVD